VLQNTNHITLDDLKIDSVENTGDVENLSRNISCGDAGSTEKSTLNFTDAENTKDSKLKV